jgi:hypothetical protein
MTRGFIIYVLPSISMIISRRMRGAKHVESVGEMINIQNIFVGKTEGNRILQS